MFLPEDIDGKEFSRTLGGYSPREVDDYLEQLKAEFERLISENGELRSEIEALAANADAGAASAVVVTAEDETEASGAEEVEVSETEEIEVSEAEETEAEPPVTDVGNAADNDGADADIDVDDTAYETADAADEDADAENADSEPETIPIPLMPDDEYGEDEVPSSDERSGEYVFETTGSGSDDDVIMNEAETAPGNDGAPTGVKADDGVDFGEAENAPGDIKFEDLEEGLLRMFGDWRDGGGSESAENADAAEEVDESDEDTSDRSDAEDTSRGVTPETDGAPATSPAPYKKRTYRMRKKHAADNEENDDDSDFALHEYDEYNYFFGDGKK